MTPFITIVMPVRNEARFIRETLGQLLDQDYPADCFEIIVADGMSDDGTPEIVTELGRRFPQLKLVPNPKRLSSAGRNLGFQHGRGDYFLVVDGHCFIPTSNLFKHLVDCFRDSGADCLGRPQPQDPPGLTPFQRAVALARGSRLGHGGDSLIYGEFEGFASPVSNGAAYTRRVFEVVGYLDEEFDAAEDVEFNYRVEQSGLLCYTSHRLTVRYYPRENLQGLFCQMRRYGIGRWRFLCKHPKALTVNQLVPSLFTVGLATFLAATAVALCTGHGWTAVAVMGVPFALYAALVLAEAARIVRSDGGRIGVLVPSILLAVHLGLGIGFLKGALGR